MYAENLGKCDKVLDNVMIMMMIAMLMMMITMIIMMMMIKSLVWMRCMQRIWESVMKCWTM